MKSLFTNLLVTLAIATTVDFAVADAVPGTFQGTWILSSGLTSIMRKEASPVEDGMTRVLGEDSIGRVGQNGSIDTLRLGLDIKHIKINPGGLNTLMPDVQEIIASTQEAIGEVEEPFLDKGKEILFNEALNMPGAEILIIGGQKGGLGNIEILSLVTKVEQRIQWIELVVVTQGQNQTKIVQIFDAAKQLKKPGSAQFPEEFTNSTGMSFRLIPAGEFMMGSPESELEGDSDEPQHEVTLTKSFYMATYEVTQKQGLKAVRLNPSKFKGMQNPVEQVSWFDAVAFCNRLSALPREKAAGLVYRLPTEAEWEYACRGGAETAYSFGGNSNNHSFFAWHDGNSGGTTHAAGQGRPNSFGLYDMHGNVWEWCADWYDDTYPEGPLIDPVGPDIGLLRVFRGGCWTSSAKACRSASRSAGVPSFRNVDVGFRVALNLWSVKAP